jgi:argininosuccinate lyase
MQAGIDAGMMATDLADFLVGLGVPFREAHHLAGRAVTASAGRGKALDSLSLAEFQELGFPVNPEMEAAIRGVFDPRESVKRRKSSGGTAPEAVLEQLQLARRALNRPAAQSNQRSSF